MNFDKKVTCSPFCIGLTTIASVGEVLGSEADVSIRTFGEQEWLNLRRIRFGHCLFCLHIHSIPYEVFTVCHKVQSIQNRVNKGEVDF